MEGHGPPPGWYADPDGSPRRRWWDGTRWTEYLQGAQPAPYAPPRYSGAGWKIALGVLLVLCVAIGGCFVVIGQVVDEGVDEVKKELQRHAITPEQFRSVE